MKPPIYHFKRTTAPRAPRTNPEHALQLQLAQYLRFCLPPEIEWTSSLAGAYLGPSQRSKMKASGLRPGWPDIQLCIRRRVHFVELKAPLAATPRHPERLGTLDDPDLSEDQRRVLAALHPDAWCICRSIDEAVHALQGWGVKLRALPDAALVWRPPAL